MGDRLVSLRDHCSCIEQFISPSAVQFFAGYDVNASREKVSG
jgi:hypothetical protein